MNGANASPWQAHEAPRYDEIMRQRCAELVQTLKSDAAYRVQVRTDPAQLHKYLFQQFTPNGFEEYAGTYRGTANTSLHGRTAGARSVINYNEAYSFVAPDEVFARMAMLRDGVERHLLDANTHAQRLSALAFQFAWFGRIHPFLDGNGHVQRTIFAALAIEFGFSLSDGFTIHPRPYDRLFAIALELFARAPLGEANEQLGIVGEYLHFFIA